MAPYRYKQSWRQDSTTSYTAVRSTLDSLSSTPAGYGLLRTFGVRSSAQIGSAGAACDFRVENSHRGDVYILGVYGVHVLLRNATLCADGVNALTRTLQTVSFKSGIIDSWLHTRTPSTLELRLYRRPYLKFDDWKSWTLGSHGGPNIASIKR
jgi:hypothetical protein